jgi:hypothetical protein
MKKTEINKSVYKAIKTRIKIVENNQCILENVLKGSTNIGKDAINF